MQLHLYHLHETWGAGGLPAGVVRVLNSKACRSAIMFGDSLVQTQVRSHQALPRDTDCAIVNATLTLSCFPTVQCQQLVDALKRTQQCFSCAHGRPTVAAVVDLNLLRQAVQLLPGRAQPASDSTTAGLKHRLQQALVSKRW